LLPRALRGRPFRPDRRRARRPAGRQAPGEGGDGGRGVTRVFIPRDAAALAVGAEGVARAVAAEAARRGADVQIVRTGSRGMFWLEPLVEIETPAGRVAYGPASAADVAGLFDAGFLE